MRKATVVIGANYGDEGKGLMTDFFAAMHENSLVVRFNGGCQASHTVTTPAGQRHAFSHFGSGTFAGANTYLSQHFAVNPPLFLKELPTIQALWPNQDLPVVYVDMRAPVTTFFDMLVNQLVEDFRGTNRHGSCGMGFGETIGRHEGKLFALTVKDLLDVAVLRQQLATIRDVHLPARCKELGLPDFGQHQALCTNDTLIDAFVAASQDFLKNVKLVASAADVVADHEHIVFEGAQGLLLDQDRGTFPFVTRSNTGLHNAIAVALEAGLEALDVVYVTRAYLTRHGAGPLANELDVAPYSQIVDLTNQPNAYQGTLRFAYLDHDGLANAIHADVADTLDSAIRIQARLAVTCLDQVGSVAYFWEDGVLQSGTPADQVAALSKKVLLVSHCSYGPTRADIVATGAGLKP